MRVIDLFSCIGGHAIGLAECGFLTIQFVEINEQRRALIASKFPGVPIHDAVQTFRPVPGSAELLVGGPPCQRTSKASAIHGKRDGHSLWPDMLRVAQELGAEWVLVEQPPGHAEWEAKVGRDLAEAGYHSGRFEFAASDLGAPHRRRRVFILAHACLARLAIARFALPQEIERYARAAATGNHWAAGPPRALRVAHGVSEWMDRNAAVEAIGDSNPPQMVTVIGRAILKSVAD